MNVADVELAKMAYLASSLGVLLFTSIILRGLWRPLRFVLLACTVSIMFTPYIVYVKMPDGSDKNIVPAYIVMLHKIADDRSHWQDIAVETGKPITVIATISSGLALILSLILPKPRKKLPPSKNKTADSKRSGKSKNPYLPDDFQGNNTSTKRTIA